MSTRRKIERTESTTIMEEIFTTFDKVRTNWKEAIDSNNKAAAVRARRALDSIGSLKIKVRKAMLSEEAK